MPRTHVLGRAIRLSLFASALSLPVAALAQQPAPPEQAEEEITTLVGVEVRPQLESKLRALDLQRSSDAIIGVVSSDSLGQYPDKNVAESLQRLPGISVTRDQGEGRFVVIRGLDANLNSVSVNGMPIGTPEDSSRQATLDVIPSDSTERLTVVKAPTPDMSGDAIGGSIEIESASAFDRDGRSVRARVEASYVDLSSDINPKAAFNFSDVYGGGTLGVALGVNFSERDFESDNVEVEYDFNDDLGRDVLIPINLQYRKYFVNRERTGANLNFDWRPEAGGQYYLRTLFSEFVDAETRQRSIFAFEDGELASADGDTLEFIDLPPDALARRLRFRTKDQRTLAVSAGGRNDFDRATLDYNIGYTDTRERVPDEVESRFEYDGVGDLGATVDMSRGVPRFTLDDPGGPDAYLRNANYELDRLVLVPKSVDDDEFQAGANLSFDAGPATWKTGVVGRWRSRSADVGEVELRVTPDLNLDEWTGGSISHRFGDLGDGISVRRMLDYLRENAGEFGERPQDVADNLILSLADDYSADEDIMAAYFMGTFDVGDLRIIAGGRFERTDFDAVGNVVELDDDGDLVLPVTSREVSSSYDSFLPGLHLRYDGVQDWVIRGAWTNTIARPSFGDLSPRQAINREDLEVDAGNPDLDPYESSNLDFSAEYYIGESGVFSVGVFHKDVDGYIAETTTDSDPDFPGFDVTRPVNGDEATVLGIELNWQQQLDFLPGAASGMLVGLAATYLDTEFTLPQRPGETFTLPRASENVYSAYVGYEWGGLSTRLSLANRGEYLDSIGDDPNFDLYVAENTQLDFTLSYEFAPNWGMYLEASNLLDEALELYQGTSDRTLQLEEYGRSYAVGVRFNF
jgi:TonB-dependent receptor